MEIIISSLALLVLFYQSVFSKIKAGQKARNEQKKPAQARTQSSYPFFVKWKTFFPLVFHFLMICIAALLLANLFLFPLYTLQLSFPNFFALFLFLFVILITAYYTYSYWHSFSENKSKSNFSIALAFLGHRLLHNTVFLLSILFFVTLLVGSIILITTYNIDVLYDSRKY